MARSHTRASYSAAKARTRDRCSSPKAYYFRSKRSYDQLKPRPAHIRHLCAIQAADGRVSLDMPTPQGHRALPFHESGANGARRPSGLVEARLVALIQPCRNRIPSDGETCLKAEDTELASTDTFGGARLTSCELGLPLERAWSLARRLPVPRAVSPWIRPKALVDPKARSSSSATFHFTSYIVGEKPIS
jgi:hypothetical protein